MVGGWGFQNIQIEPGVEGDPGKEGLRGLGIGRSIVA